MKNMTINVQFQLNWRSWLVLGRKLRQKRRKIPRKWLLFYKPVDGVLNICMKMWWSYIHHSLHYSWQFSNKLTHFWFFTPFSFLLEWFRFASSTDMYRSGLMMFLCDVKTPALPMDLSFHILLSHQWQVDLVIGLF